MSDKEILRYKEYRGSIESSVEDECLYGKVLFVRDTILYEGNTIPELKKAFEAAVDAYLESCEAVGREPQKSYTGSFNVRIGGDRHKKLACLAHINSDSINSHICKALDNYFESKTVMEEGEWRAPVLGTTAAKQRSAGRVNFKLVS